MVRAFNSLMRPGFYFMAKELPFFKFEVSEWMFGRIQKQPLEVQGTFINLCCKYWHKLGELSHDDAELDFHKDHIKSLIDCRVIAVDDGYIVVKFLDIQLDERKEVSRISSLKGKKSAELRFNRKQLRSTSVEPDSTDVQPTSTEEKRREEKRVENTLREAVCEIFGKTYQLPLDRMPQMANWYSTIDLECDKILKVYTDISEATKQVRAYIKLCRDQKRKLIGLNYKVSETILSSDWVKLLTPMNGTGSGIKVGETRKVHAG